MIAALNQIMLVVSDSPALSICVKSTLIVLLCLLAIRLSRRRSAAARHALLASAFGVLLVLPAASLLAPPIRVAVPREARETTSPLAPAPAASAGVSLPTGARAANVIIGADSPPRRLYSGRLPVLAWIAGAIVVLLPLILGLRKLRSLRRSARPWPHGQSVADALALEAGIRRPVEVRLHEALHGPMTCGALRPAILLHPGAQSWEAEDLRRALVHELEHVRRCDWLSYALARAVGAMYWFHPLVWIALRRLALEAERSCDDAVLVRSEATAYAGQLVGLARRISGRVKTPVLAMANPADLAARIGSLLDARQKRGRVGAVSVAVAFVAAAALALAISPLEVVAAPQSSTPPAPQFEAASVKLLDPDTGEQHSTEHNDPIRLTMTGNLHRFLIRAYGITDGQLGEEPAWFRSHLYSIDAVAAAPSNHQQLLVMLRGVLADRFQLKLRQEDRDLPAYTLEVAPGGPKFKELKPGEAPHRDPDTPAGVYARTFTTMSQLVNTLNNVFGGIMAVDRPVVDRTRLTGRYDMQLQTAMEIQSDDAGRRTRQFPDLFHDMQSQLGLKLVAGRVKMPYYIIEGASEPRPN